MRIVFCGTPDYAVPSLRRLAAAREHEIVAVVSQPDKPKGRSGTPTPPPVVAAARELGLAPERVFQPKSINSRTALDALRALAPDVLCVIAYGNLLRQPALDLARIMPINAHGSLLPKYRGASPIQAALLAGDAQTGVSIMKMEAGLDSGPYFLRRAIPIEARDDAGTLHDKLADLSAECLTDALTLLARGDCALTPQDESQVSHAPKLEKNSGRIDWARDAAGLRRFIQAMNPWPGAWTEVASGDGKQRQRVRVAGLGETILPGGGGAGAGAFNKAAGGFEVACGGGALLIQTLQPEGKRVMSVEEFVRGAGKNFVTGSRWK
jgi:methionyl-tRNA formyltransferase